MNLPTSPKLPTSQTEGYAHRAFALTDHDELIKFLEFQQEQIRQLTAHAREISIELALTNNGCVTLSTASNNGHQEAFDSPETGEPKTAPSQVAWQIPPPELRAHWRERAPRFRDGGIGREDWLMDRAACWAFSQCESKIQAATQTFIKRVRV